MRRNPHPADLPVHQGLLAALAEEAAVKDKLAEIEGLPAIRKNESQAYPHPNEKGRPEGRPCRSRLVEMVQKLIFKAATMVVAVTSSPASSFIASVMPVSA